MKEYLINSGEFNVLVQPELKQVYILNDPEVSKKVSGDFVEGVELSLTDLKPLWFDYQPDESWSDFGGEKHALGVDFSESDLIDRFVVKRFNFGGLVAERDLTAKRLKVFKKEKLAL